MLGYTKEDLDTMVDCLSDVLLTVDEKAEPWKHGNIERTKSFLEGLWAEGYFDYK